MGFWHILLGIDNSGGAAVADNSSTVCPARITLERAGAHRVTLEHAGAYRLIVTHAAPHKVTVQKCGG